MSKGIRYKYLDYLAIDKNIQEQYSEQVKEIRGKFSNATIRIEKLRSPSNSNLFSFRLNADKRVVCKIVHQDKKNYLKIEKIFLNHDEYEEYINKHRNRNTEINDVEIIDKFADHELNTAENVYDKLPTMGIAEINKEIIILDSEQLKVLDEEKNTGKTTVFQIIGPPGSGKTLVAEILMNEHSTKKGLYITKSEELIDNVNQYAQDQWSCKTFKDLCDQLIEGKHVCDRTNFIKYIIQEKEFKQRYSEFKKNLTKGTQPSEEYYAKVIYESICKINDDINDGNKSQMMGKKQNNDNDVESSNTTLKSYKQHLGQDKIDLSLMTIEKNNLSRPEEDKYDYIMIDEAQNFYKSELRYVQSFLKPQGKIYFFMDTNQSIYSDINLTSQYINNLSREHDCILTTYHFKNGYRTSCIITEAANQMTQAKRAIIGGEFHKDAPKSIESASSITGCIRWIDRLLEGNETESSNDIILKNLQKESEEHKANKVALGVIIPSSDYRKDAKKLFPERLVFTPEEVSGLEFQKIVLYNFFSGNYPFNFINQIKSKSSETYNKIQDVFSTNANKTNFPKAIDYAKENLSCTEFFNKTLVAMTRSVSDLYVIETQKTVGSELLREQFEKISHNLNGKETGFEANSAVDKDAIDMILLMSEANFNRENFLELCKEISTLEIDQERKPKLIAKIDKTIKKLEQGDNEAEKQLKHKNNKAYVKELKQCLESLNKVCENQDSSQDRSDASRISSTSSTSSIGAETQQNTKKSDILTENDNGNKTPTKNKNESPIKNGKGSVDSPKKSKNRKRSTGNEQTVNPPSSKREMTARKVIEGEYNIDSFTKEELEQICEDDAKGRTVLSVLLSVMGTQINKLDLKDLNNFILRINSDVLNATNLEGQSAAYYLVKNALKYQLPHVVLKTLIDKADCKTLCTIGPCGWSPIHYLYSVKSQPVNKPLNEKLNDYIQTLKKELTDDAIITRKVRETVRQAINSTFNLDYKKLCEGINKKCTALDMAICTPLDQDKDKNTKKLYTKFLLKHGANINSKENLHGTAPLHMAASAGDTESVQLLLAKDGVDINAQDKEGSTPLHIAVLKGHTKIVKLLLAKNGVEVNLQDKEGSTPLHIAVFNGHTKVVKLLLAKNGVEVNLQDKAGHTPLHIAVFNGHTKVVKLLLAKNGVEVNAKNNQVMAPLHIAALAGHKEIVKLLLAKNGIEVNLQDKAGNTPLHIAIVQGRKDIVELLLDNPKTNCSTIRRAFIRCILKYQGIDRKSFYQNYIRPMQTCITSIVMNVLRSLLTYLTKPVEKGHTSTIHLNEVGFKNDIKAIEFTKDYLNQDPDQPSSSTVESTVTHALSDTQKR